MSKINPSLPTIIQRANTVQKAIKDIRYINVKQQVQNALNIKNKVSTTKIKDLPMNLLVLI